MTVRVVCLALYLAACHASSTTPSYTPLAQYTRQLVTYVYAPTDSTCAGSVEAILTFPLGIYPTSCVQPSINDNAFVPPFYDAVNCDQYDGITSVSYAYYTNFTSGCEGGGSSFMYLGSSDACQRSPGMNNYCVNKCYITGTPGPPGLNEIETIGIGVGAGVGGAIVVTTVICCICKCCSGTVCNPTVTAPAGGTVGAAASAAGRCCGCCRSSKSPAATPTPSQTPTAVAAGAAEGTTTTASTGTSRSTASADGRPITVHVHLPSCSSSGASYSGSSYSYSDTDSLMQY